MLVEFQVGNYRSFKEVATLSMVASRLASRDRRLDENTVFEPVGGPKLLTSAAIYGANASGKSNLVAALRFMREFVLNSPNETRPTGKIGVEPFRLSTDTAGQPTFFQVVFIHLGRRYRYGFEATTERVVSEWLYHVPTTREARLFERREGRFTTSNAFREGRDLGEKTRPNALFLSVAAQFNGPIAQSILQWFLACNVVSGLQDVTFLPFTALNFYNGRYADEIRGLIQRLDTGIADVQVEKGPLAPPEEMPETVPEPLREAIQVLFRGLSEAEGYSIRTLHHVFDGQGQIHSTEVFDLDAQESEGTKKLFSLAGPLIDTLRSGRVLVVDELDARLHPLITREIVDLFNSEETNPKHAQLILTTQDTNLLDNKLFRRDQIWFTEKDRQGVSRLFSLAEYRIRNDASLERDYIRGRYGAIPFIGDLGRLLEKPDA